MQVVNRLKQDFVHQIILEYGVSIRVLGIRHYCHCELNNWVFSIHTSHYHTPGLQVNYDKTLIYDKIHHEVRL